MRHSTHVVFVVDDSSPFSLSPVILSSISSFTSASISPLAALRESDGLKSGPTEVRSQGLRQPSSAPGPSCRRPASSSSTAKRLMAALEQTCRAVARLQLIRGGGGAGWARLTLAERQVDCTTSGASERRLLTSYRKVR